MANSTRKMRVAVFGVIIVLSYPALCLAIGIHSPRGQWPKSWPKQLEPYRTQANTESHGTPTPDGNYVETHTIAFYNRDEFERAWSALVKVKGKGAPITLRSDKASILVVNSEDNTKAKVVAVRLRCDTRPPRCKSVELFVDGKIIDLNRIRLPADTPIVDKRAFASEQAALPLAKPQPSAPKRRTHASWSCWETAVGGNGHGYKAVVVPEGVTWQEAHKAALKEGAYLATIASMLENEFVFSLVDFPEFWKINEHNGVSYGPWIGGHQMPGSAESGNGWIWVTGEAFSYANWFRQNPNNADLAGKNQDRIHFIHRTYPDRANLWNDLAGDERLRGYVVEKPRE